MLTWKRTVIGGDELNHDFCAVVDGNITIARIFRSQDSSSQPVWSANMQIGNASSEACLSRQDAIGWVEQRFAHFLTTEKGKTDPQEWPSDQRSMHLGYLRQNNPQEYAVLLEGLRSGRVERIRRKT